MQARRRYPSDLSDQQWETIKDLLPTARPGGRRRTTNLRTVLDALMYLMRTGGAWRYLPKEFPPWKTVYHYFSIWNASGIFEKINLILTQTVREKYGREKAPTLGIVDSQSIRAHYGEARGWDGFKKIRGRKRHIIVDSMGLLLACAVHSASERDPHGGVRALDKIPASARTRLKVILGDAAYVGPFDDVAHFCYGIRVERSQPARIQSNLKPKRWIVERTISWFNHFRRLSRDYERRTAKSEAMIYLAMITILLQKLTL